jgi:lipoprotein-anchoring transpeptidase ErfK/SrfK
MNNPLTRREFLKLSGAGLLGLALSELGLDSVRADEQLPHPWGRIVQSGINLYDQPSFKSKQLKIFGRDEVVPLTAAVPGDDPTAYNPTWYKIGNDGFTYSGWVQPVEKSYNRPVFTIPESGVLGEITVPFTDIRRETSLFSDRGFRLFYSSTHWITGVALNKDEKTIWYEVYDDEMKMSYYVQAQDMRIIPDEELAPLSPDVPNSEKRIYIDLASQTVTAFEGDTTVLTARCASGTKGTKTPLGDYLTYHKAPTVHMTDAEPRETGTYDLPGVPWVTFFTGSGHSFHGTYWHNDYGSPRSHGCINLTPEDARFIYLWTHPVVPPNVRYLHLPGDGTSVEIVKPAA